tara:strand:- start:56 stop:268 length:213 start_codon:yes stop_codon:yes gene_type:complete
MKFIKLQNCNQKNEKGFYQIEIIYIEISKICSLSRCKKNQQTFIETQNGLHSVIETPEQIIELIKQQEQS